MQAAMLSGVAVLLLLCGSAVCKSHQQQWGTGPAFIWGSSAYTLPGPDGQRSRVAYQSQVASILSEVLSIAAGNGVPAEHALLNVTAFASAPPSAALAIIGHQLRLQDLSSSLQKQALHPLRSALDAAEGSLALPHVAHVGKTGLGQTLATQLELLQTEPLLLGACPGAEGRAAMEPLAVLGEALQAGTAQLFLLCTSPADSLQEELLVLGKAAAALQETGKQHFIVYAVDPSMQAIAAARRRSLLQTVLPTHMAGLSLPGHEGEITGSSMQGSPVPTSYLCNSKCQAQVRFIESFILALLVIVAVAGGSFMMHVLDTPTRFETPKVQRHQD